LPASRQIEFGLATLEPLAHTKFCSRYHNECASFDRHHVHNVPTTGAILQELEVVNQAINKSIIATPKRERGPMSPMQRRCANASAPRLLRS
jgi:predicted transglutaminase-like cysteine proteinase